MREMYCLTWNSMSMHLSKQKRDALPQSLPQSCRPFSSMSIYDIWLITWLLVKVSVSVKVLKHFQKCLFI